MLGPKIIVIFGIIVILILTIDCIKDSIWREEKYKIQGWKYCGPIGKLAVHCSDEERKMLIAKHDRIRKERVTQYWKSQAMKRKFLNLFRKNKK